MNIDLNDYDKQHAAYIEELTKKLESIYQAIIRQAVKYGLSVNFDETKGSIFDFDKFPKLKKRMEELMAEMQSRILALVENGITSEWGLSDDKNDYLVAKILASASLTEDEIKQYQTRNREALATFQQRKVNGLGLSDRVWNLTNQFKTELELALDVGIGEGRSAQQISRDIRGYLNQPDKLFRRVRDKHGNLKLSKAAAAYHPGQGVYRSSYKNALRMARTEVNMAYRSADYERWNEEWFVIGIEIKLSNNHTCNGKPFVDICDYLKGKYPKTFKFTGWHPQCRCYAVPVLCSDEEFVEYIKARREGKDVSNWKFKSEVKDMPKGFTGWMKDNAERVERMKSKPYFIVDNEKMIYPENNMTEEIRKRRKEIAELVGSSLLGKTFKNPNFDNALHLNKKGIKEWLNQPHSQYADKNEMLLDIEDVLKSSTYRGWTHYHKENPMIAKTHVFETSINGEKSYILAREDINGNISIYSISESDKVLNGIQK